MFDYARNMQLALSDMGRRAGLKAGAGAAILIGAGFLLAALWTWLAHHLGWGSLRASLAVGAGFVMIGLVVAAAGGRRRHRIPTTDELQAEVEQRLGLATDAMLGKARDRADEVVQNARAKATEVIGDAEARVHGFVDDVTYRMNSFADAAETRVQGAAQTVASKTAQSLGVSPAMVRDATEAARNGVERFRHSRAAPAIGLLGALTLGAVAANLLNGALHRDDEGDDDFQDDEDWPDEYDPF